MTEETRTIHIDPREGDQLVLALGYPAAENSFCAYLTASDAPDLSWLTDRQLTLLNGLLRLASDRADVEISRRRKDRIASASALHPREQDQR